MGYTTEFTGEFIIAPEVKEEHKAYINKFADTRRMLRDSAVLEKMDDPICKAVGLPVGTDGEFFVGGLGVCGQEADSSVLNHNKPPATQPGLWCQWVVSDTDGSCSLVWDGGEKFYCYIEWLQYLVDNFFKPWGYKLNGDVAWNGEGCGDFGHIIMVDNEITVNHGG